MGRGGRYSVHPFGPLSGQTQPGVEICAAGEICAAEL